MIKNLIALFTIMSFSAYAASVYDSVTVESTLKLSGQTASTVPYLDASNNFVSSAVTPTELGYLSGVTGGIQTQLGNKEPNITATTSADYYRGDKTFQNFDNAARASVVASSIVDADLTHSPDGNSVFDALALKEDVANKSTDGTLSANSDTLYPSQKAVKTYADSLATAITDSIYVDGNLGSDVTGTGTLSKPFATIQKSLDYVGQPTSLQDALRHIIINVSGKTAAPAALFSGIYTENLTVPNRFITMQGYGVKVDGNILKEYSSSRRFGASSSEFRPTLTVIGFSNARDSHPRIRNGFHVGGTMRTSILTRNADTITGNGTNKVTIHVTTGQFNYPITVSTPAIRIKVNGTASYNFTYDITAQIDATTFEATRVSGTNAATSTESGSFFESDSAGASGVTHDSHFINTYMQGAYTCDDGTVNGAATTAGTEVLYSVGSRWFTGIEGRTITMQRWDNNTLAGTNIVSSIAGVNNTSISGNITTNTFTYGTDDMGFINNRFNGATVFTVNSAAQTARMDSVSYNSFLTAGGTWAVNTPTISFLDNSKAVGYTPTTSANWNSVPTTSLSAFDTLASSGIVKSQTQNLFSASPNGSSGVPSFRAIVAADLPNTAVTPGSYTLMSATVDSQGRITSASNGSAIQSLNGETGATQTFATGTAGTDFGISSATNVHTFNVPTASAVNRGALSSADWSTFNGKEPAIAATTSADYYRGDKTFQNFDSAAQAASISQVITNGVTTKAPSEDAVFDALGLKFDTSSFTDAAVTGKLITGFVSGAGTVAATDTILQAINKLDGNTNGKEVPLTFSTGLTRTVNTVTVNTSQNISTLSNLTSNGFVKTSGGTGALSIDTTVYESVKVSSNITANTTLASTTRYYFGDTTGGAFTVTLPAAASNDGIAFTVKHTTFGGLNDITVAMTGGDTLDGGAGDTITAGEAKTYVSNGTNWFLAQ